MIIFHLKVFSVENFYYIYRVDNHTFSLIILKYEWKKEGSKNNCEKDDIKGKD